MQQLANIVYSHAVIRKHIVQLILDFIRNTTIEVLIKSKVLIIHTERIKLLLLGETELGRTLLCKLKIEIRQEFEAIE